VPTAERIHKSVETAYAISSGTNLFASGYNPWGIVGGSTLSIVSSPYPVPTVVNATDVAIGIYHTIVAQGDGRVYTWGDNSWYQLGTGSQTRQQFPILQPYLSQVTSVCATQFSSAALQSDQFVYTYGQNGFGECAQTAAPVTTPTQVPGISSIIAIGCGARHMIALKSNGVVYTWGRNIDGELGLGTLTSSYNTPQALSVSAVRVFAGAISSFYTLSDGSLYASGDNTNGNLGFGHQNSVRAFNASIKNVQSVSASAESSLFLLRDGTVMGCGMNSDGQLGMGDTQFHLTPTLVPKATEIVAVGTSSPPGSFMLAMSTCGGISFRTSSVCTGKGKCVRTNQCLCISPYIGKTCQSTTFYWMSGDLDPLLFHVSAPKFQ
jgi:alpha-tubulin suppressor-like RCC1 family protein